MAGYFQDNSRNILSNQDKYFKAANFYHNPRKISIAYEICKKRIVDSPIWDEVIRQVKIRANQFV